ncbi:MAG: SET domain-containing protein-lysine N-methyltransferase [Cyclobacteriaceae bacterium]|nr:SET domain-containing protein-lysine N-methyltransferase [Cyclobacteriaceae bacterium]
MTKEELLSELSNTYVMLRPSPIEGIGVFALKDIPKGCREVFSKHNTEDKWIEISKEEVERLPSHVQLLIGNYCLYDKDHYFVPDYGFKKIDLSLFLNHSDEPNVISVNEGEYFQVIRDISHGEELVINYGEIVED